MRLIKSVRGAMIAVIGPPDQAGIAKLVMEQLTKDEPLRARLQCSLVTLPLALARERGLAAGVVVAADEPKFAELTRAAAKSGGALHNLSEVAAPPLHPFALAAPAKSTVPEAQRLRVRGEMVPVSAT